MDLILWTAVSLHLTGIFLAFIFHDPKPDLFLDFSNETEDNEAIMITIMK